MNPTTTHGWIVAALLALPLPAAAVGLGPIDVDSGLNQRFEARIALTGLAPGEIDALRARFADDDAFARAGIERAPVLAGFAVDVRPGDGGGHLRIRSRDFVREPSLSFVVEIESGGQIVQRRYDVLLSLR